jgi:hypothetical protein
MRGAAGRDRAFPRLQRREFDYDSYRILTRLLRDSRYRTQPLPPA